MKFIHIYIGGYKGYGLAMMVEIFCGILSGGAFGPFVRQWKDFDNIANLVRLINNLILKYFLMSLLASKVIP